MNSRYVREGWMIIEALGCTINIMESIKSEIVAIQVVPKDIEGMKTIYVEGGVIDGS